MHKTLRHTRKVAGVGVFKYPDRHDPPSCETPSSLRAPSTSGTDETHGPRITPRHPAAEFQHEPVKGDGAQRGGESKPNFQSGQVLSLPATSHSLCEAAQIIQIWRDLPRRRGDAQSIPR